MNSYKTARLGDICKIIKGATGIASAKSGEYPLVVTAQERKTCSTYQFDCEAVCIPLVSSSGHGKKSLKNVHYQSGKFALGSILCAVIPNNPDELDARYLHQYLQFYKDTLLVPLMKGAANVSLSMRDIAKVEIPLVPIEKQKSLADMFVSLNEKQATLFAEYEKQSEYGKLLRQNILQDAIEGKLTADWRKQNPVVKGNPNFDAEALFEKIQEERCHADSELLRNSKKKETCHAKHNARLHNVSLSGSCLSADRLTRQSVSEDEIPFELPYGWAWKRLGEICETIPSKKYQILEKEIQLKGNFPVISQSAKFIEGYTDKKDVVFKINSIPIIIFGDHTRNIKYINFDFVVGADGVKILKPKNIDAKFLYYSVTFASSKIENRGYGRHFQFLNKILYPLPPLAEQKEIVARVEKLLQTVTELENQIAERQEQTKQLAQVILKDAFEEK